MTFPASETLTVTLSRETLEILWAWRFTNKIDGLMPTKEEAINAIVQQEPLKLTIEDVAEWLRGTEQVDRFMGNSRTAWVYEDLLDAMDRVMKVVKWIEKEQK